MVPVLGATLQGMAALSWVYWTAAAWSVRRWRNQPVREPFTPPVSVLKPLCGAEEGLTDNLEALYSQEYPDFEVVFGAEDADDPAMAIARAVAERHPERRSSFVHSAAPAGANRKVANLCQIAPTARHAVLVLADSDVRWPAAALAQVCAPLADPGVGLATCPYVGRGGHGIAALMEALGIGASFIPSAMLAAALGRRDFALGATMAIRRGLLAEIGGFEGLLGNIADDYLLGHRAAAAGARVAFSAGCVETVLQDEPISTSLQRRLRWAATVRSLQPAGAAGALLTHGLPLAVLGALAAPSGAAWLFVGATAAARGLNAAYVLGLLGDTASRGRLWLLPLDDLVAFALWAWAPAVKRVTWRGRRYRLGPGGRVVAAD